MDSPPTEKLLTEESREEPAKEIKHDPTRSTAPAVSLPPGQHPPSSQHPYHPQGPGQTGPGTHPYQNQQPPQNQQNRGPGTYEPLQGPRRYPFGAARLPRNHPLAGYIPRKERAFLGLQMKDWAISLVLLMFLLPTVSFFLFMDNFDHDYHRDAPGWEQNFTATTEEGGYYRFTLAKKSYPVRMDLTFQVSTPGNSSHFDVYIMDHDQYWNSYSEENDGKEQAFAAQQSWENTTNVSKTVSLPLERDNSYYLVIDNRDSSLRSQDAVPTGILEVDIYVHVLLTYISQDHD